MSGIPVNASLEERISTRTNKPYKCIVIEIAPGVEKVVFLTAAEAALIELR